MSAKRNLKGHLKEHGYNDLPGLTVIAKECRIKNIDFYTEMAGKNNPALFFREDGEWLVAMKLCDFMDIYREWEMSIPFYGTGIAEGENDDGI